MNETPNQISEAPSQNFERLATARRQWIETVLRPWCCAAALQELRKAEQEWTDIAGRVDPAATLWTWAWERFPDLVHPELPGVNETHRITISLAEGAEYTGYPDGRRSARGTLILLDTDACGQSQTHGPFSIDQIRSARTTTP